MIKLGVLGAGGRMGRRIIELALNDKELEVILALERKGHHLIGKNIDKVKISSTPDGIFLADAIIDFTIPEASMENLAYCLQYNKPLVLATTGFNEEQTVKIRDAAKSIAIVFSPNMSVGVNLLFGVVGEIAKKLGPGYDIEMVEAHHKAKKTLPREQPRSWPRLLPMIQEEIFRCTLFAPGISSETIRLSMPEEASGLK